MDEEKKVKCEKRCETEERIEGKGKERQDKNGIVRGGEKERGSSGVKENKEGRLDETEYEKGRGEGKRGKKNDKQLKREIG